MILGAAAHTVAKHKPNCCDYPLLVAMFAREQSRRRAASNER